MIENKNNCKPEAALIVELYRLAELRRPIEDAERIDAMYAGSRRTLLDQVRASAGPAVQFVLRASVIAQDYYSHIGWQKIENGWFCPRGN